MKITMKVDSSKFQNKVTNLLTAVAQGSSGVTKEFTEALYSATLTEVPKDTNTLSSSAYREVEQGFLRTHGVVGYGGNGDPMNPKSRRHASEYMVVIHEDLSMNHPNGGKAKYLENPARRLQDEFVQKRVPGLLARLAAWFNGR